MLAKTIETETNIGGTPCRCEHLFVVDDGLSSIECTIVDTVGPQQVAWDGQARIAEALVRSFALLHGSAHTREPDERDSVLEKGLGSLALGMRELPTHGRGRWVWRDEGAILSLNSHMSLHSLAAHPGRQIGRTRQRA